MSWLRVRRAAAHQAFSSQTRLKARSLCSMSTELKHLRSGLHRTRTSGFIVRLLPVDNDERRAALHGHYSDVGGGQARRRCHILIAALLIGEVSEGWGDGARLLWLFVRLVHHVRSCTQGRRQQFSPPAACLLVSRVDLQPRVLTYEALLAHDVHLWRRQRTEYGGVFIQVKMAAWKTSRPNQLGLVYSHTVYTQQLNNKWKTYLLEKTN